MNLLYIHSSESFWSPYYVPRMMFNLMLQTKEGSPFSFLKIHFAICKVMVLRVGNEFTLMFPKMYSRILLKFYQKN